MDDSSMGCKSQRKSQQSVLLHSLSLPGDCTTRRRPLHSPTTHPSLHSGKDCFEFAPTGSNLVPFGSVVRRAAGFKVKTRAITRWISYTDNVQLYTRVEATCPCKHNRNRSFHLLARKHFHPCGCFCQMWWVKESGFVMLKLEQKLCVCADSVAWIVIGQKDLLRRNKLPAPGKIFPIFPNDLRR